MCISITRGSILCSMTAMAPPNPQSRSWQSFLLYQLIYLLNSIDPLRQQKCQLLQLSLEKELEEGNGPEWNLQTQKPTNVETTTAWWRNLKKMKPNILFQDGKNENIVETKKYISKLSNYNVYSWVTFKFLGQFQTKRTEQNDMAF